MYTKKKGGVFLNVSFKNYLNSVVSKLYTFSPPQVTKYFIVLLIITPCVTRCINDNIYSYFSLSNLFYIIILLFKASWRIRQKFTAHPLRTTVLICCRSSTSRVITRTKMRVYIFRLIMWFFCVFLVVSKHLCCFLFLR